MVNLHTANGPTLVLAPSGQSLRVVLLYNVQKAQRREITLIFEIMKPRGH